MTGWGARTFFGGGGGGGGSSPIDLTDTVISEFNEQSAVPSGVPTTVVSYTVGAITTHLMNVEFGGTNHARYAITINGVTKGACFTYYGELNGTWDFRGIAGGLPLSQGDVVAVTALHLSNDPGTFYCRLNMLQITNPPPP